MMFLQDASASGMDKQTMEASKDMEADEQTFNVPVPLGPKVCMQPIIFQAFQTY
jgi:hypothetical protein